MTTAVLEVVPLDYAKIKRLREQLGMTQEEAAQRAGLGNRQAWNHFETGRRPDIRLTQLERIAAALGVKARDLLK
jgi:transcriptional regulator with XRE-family HTH domain